MTQLQFKQIFPFRWILFSLEENLVQQLQTSHLQWKPSSLLPSLSPSHQGEPCSGSACLWLQKPRRLLLPERPGWQWVSKCRTWCQCLGHMHHSRSTCELGNVSVGKTLNGAAAQCQGGTLQSRTGRLAETHQGFSTAAWDVHCAHSHDFLRMIQTGSA